MSEFPTGDRRVLTDQQIAAAALQAGWDPADAAVITAITHPESAGQPGVVQSGEPYNLTGWGLTQITPGDSEPQVGINNQLLDPVTNMKAALAKFKAAGSSWSPWTADDVADAVMAGNPASQVPFLPSAQQAVAADAGLSVKQLQQLSQSTTLSGHGGGGGLGTVQGVLHDLNPLNIPGEIGTAAGQGVAGALSGLGGELQALAVIIPVVLLGAGIIALGLFRATRGPRQAAQEKLTTTAETAAPLVAAV